MKKTQIILVLVLFLAIMLALPIRTGTEVLVKPVWARSLDSAPGATTDTVTWFRLGNRFGYVDLAGTLRFVEEVLYGVALSDEGYINYSTVSENLLLYDVYGDPDRVCNVQGYPVLNESGSRLFAVKTDLSGLSELARSGESLGGSLWEKDFASPMLCMAVNDEDVVLGLLDGRCILLSNAGEPLHEYRHPELRVPITLGCAITRDSRLIGLVTGIGPQNVVLLERTLAGYAVRFTAQLDSDYRREVRMRFVEQGAFLLVEGDSSIMTFDTETGKGRALALSGPIEAMAGAETSSFAAAIVNQEGQRRLVVVGSTGGLYYSETLPEGPVSLRQLDHRLLVGAGNHVIRVDIVEG